MGHLAMDVPKSFGSFLGTVMTRSGYREFVQVGGLVPVNSALISGAIFF